MSKVKADGEIIVDLYCGIGYYSLPLLVYGKAARIHAFEWNPNSVGAFLFNLRSAGISRERCVVHFGDNSAAVMGHAPYDVRVHPQLDDTYFVRNVSTESVEEAERWSTELTDIANRVCLGLLPSSKNGWILAAKVLNPVGGVIHLHYNVKDTEILEWAENARFEFERLFENIGKLLKVKISHIEKVKSYAPRVRHIVVDLICEQYASSSFTDSRKL